MSRLLSRCWLIVIILTISALSSTSPLVQGTTTAYAGKFPDVSPSVPVHLNLTFSSAPVLDASSQLEVNVLSDLDVDNMTVQVFLPRGISRIAGGLNWTGHMTAHASSKLLATVRAVALGNWTVQAKAGYFVAAGWYGDYAEITVSIQKNAAFIVRQKTTTGPAVPVSSKEISAGPPYHFQGNITPGPPSSRSYASAPGNLLVTGAFYNYISEDSIPLPSSQRTDQLQPMVWGWVEIRDGLGNFLGGEVTGPDADDPEGRFQISINNPGALGFYAVMMPSTSAADVLQSDGSTQYTSYTSTFTTSQTTFDIGAWTPPATSDYKAAWRAYETIVNDHYGRGAWNFLVNKAGLSSSTLGMVTVEVPSPDGGTYFHIDPSTYIHVGSDTSTIALDIVQHEYGHYVMYRAYGNSFPSTDCPSPHYINAISGVVCGWTEGWADFLPLMVQGEARRSLDETPDPVFEWGTGAQINLEIPTWGTAGWDNGPRVEGRVAAALNDIYDWTDDAVDPSGGYDRFTDYFSDVWDTFINSYVTTFQDFWTAWKNRGHDQSNNLAVACLFHNTIQFSPAFNPLVVSVSPTTIVQGQYLSYAGSFFTPSGQVQIVIWNNGQGYIVGNPTATSSGTISGSFLVGTNILPGQRRITFTDITSGLVATAYVQVIELTITTTQTSTATSTVTYATTTSTSSTFRTTTTTTVTSTSTSTVGLLCTVTSTTSTTNTIIQVATTTSSTTSTSLTTTSTTATFATTTAVTSTSITQTTTTTTMTICTQTVTSTSTSTTSTTFTRPGSTMGLSATPNSIVLGSSTILSGAIAPNPGIVQVILSLSLDGVSYTRFLSVMTDSTGSYSVSWSPPYSGSYLLTASWNGNSQYQGAVSSPTSLVVAGLITPSVSLLLSAPSQGSRGQTITLSMSVFNPTTSMLTAQVAVQITGPNNYVLFDIVQVNVAASSSKTVYFEWTVPGQIGSYYVLVNLIPSQPAAVDSATIVIT